jgi:hypothetical protein
MTHQLTRDEAISVVITELFATKEAGHCSATLRGVRLALKSLAAAGAFANGPEGDDGAAPNMIDKLNAAGIG